MTAKNTCLRPLRYWIFPVLTLVIAGGWSFGTDKVASHVKTMNLARLIGAAMTSGMANQPEVPRLRSNQLFPFMPPTKPQRSREETLD